MHAAPRGSDLRRALDETRHVNRPAQVFDIDHPLGECGAVERCQPSAQGWRGGKRPDGAAIVRDPVHFVPRIYGNSRSDLMFGAGYAVPQDRMFLMDVLRHSAEASTDEILGASAAPADRDQLTHQDVSPTELRTQL